MISPRTILNLDDAYHADEEQEELRCKVCGERVRDGLGVTDIRHSAACVIGRLEEAAKESVAIRSFRFTSDPYEDEELLLSPSSFDIDSKTEEPRWHSDPSDLVKWSDGKFSCIRIDLNPSPKRRFQVEQAISDALKEAESLAYAQTQRESIDRVVAEQIRTVINPLLALLPMLNPYGIGIKMNEAMHSIILRVNDATKTDQKFPISFFLSGQNEITVIVANYTKNKRKMWTCSLTPPGVSVKIEE